VRIHGDAPWAYAPLLDMVLDAIVDEVTDATEVEVLNPADQTGAADVILAPDVERAAAALGAAAEAARRWDHHTVEQAVRTELSAERVAAKVGLLEQALHEARGPELVAVISDKPFRTGRPHRFEARIRRLDVFSTIPVPADIDHLDGAVAWVREKFPTAIITHTPEA
jgi:hypothetical protein